ncbi:MAG: hypothetical protein JWQ90_1632 [Hydrocarboniphaga sp.]|uniref:oxygenase MpaB family protein n=1 Tax=Hydrocarboniphaga sp. TaxID=2033016 RepID=UPI00263568E7|nr:oxygenase MpaB family protein [Hydrocarboniphaga sp.]MDB5969182.1 hypothetical protein [Hydrocarboniphaga sp.]
MNMHVQIRKAGIDVPLDLAPGRDLGRTVNYEQAVALYGKDLVNFITDHHKIGDEIGYAAYNAMLARDGNVAAKQMFDQALAKGIGSVENPPPEMVDLFSSLDNVPDWVDWDELHRGSVAYWRAGNIVVMALAYAAIGAGFRTYGGSRPLVLSRRLIERDQVGRRLIETLRWAANASKPGGMRRNGDGFRMTMNVRWIHGAVRHHLSRSDKWDWQDWGMVVANSDSVYTMGCLFCEAVVDALAKAGIKLSTREIDDVTALWRYIGHVMGIPEDINFHDWQDLRRKSEVIRLIEHPADDGCRMLMASLKDYMCEEEIEGYDVLPRFIAKRLSVEQKKTLTYGLMRSWAGDEICEQLAIPDNKLRYLLPTLRPFIMAHDKISRLLPHDDEAKAIRSIEAFGVATKLNDGETEVADADDVVRGMKKFSGRAHEILGSKPH